MTQEHSIVRGLAGPFAMMITTWMIITFCAYAVYYGLIPEDWSENTNIALGSTIFFNHAFGIIQRAGLTHLAIIPFILSIPFIGIITYLLWPKKKWAILNKITKRNALRIPIFALSIQFPIALMIIMYEITLGFPIGSVIFRDGFINIFSYTATYSAIILVILHFSLILSYIGNHARKLLTEVSHARPL